MITLQIRKWIEKKKARIADLLDVIYLTPREL